MSRPGDGRAAAAPILVLGSTGQVGRAFMAALGDRHEQPNVIGAGRSIPDQQWQFDLSDPHSVRRVVEAAEPSRVVMLAAATNVMWCETHPREATLINVDGVRAAVTAAAATGAALTLVSTDYVFDGNAGPYDESATTHPINSYGRQKLAAESLVLDADNRNLVVRTCQVFGPDPRRRNFPMQLIDTLRAGQQFQAPVDLFGTPTFAPDLAMALVELMASGAVGIWHFSGGRVVSRYGWALAAAQALSLEQDLVTPIHQADRYDPVPRPVHSGVVTSRTDWPATVKRTPLEDALASLAEGSAQP